MVDPLAPGASNLARRATERDARATPPERPLLLATLAESTSPLGETLIMMTMRARLSRVRLEPLLVAALGARVNLAADDGLGVGTGTVIDGSPVLDVADRDDLDRCSRRRPRPPGVTAVEGLRALRVPAPA